MSLKFMFLYFLITLKSSSSGIVECDTSCLCGDLEPTDTGEERRHHLQLAARPACSAGNIGQRKLNITII